MGAMGGDDLIDWEKMQELGNGTEEKILVLVRLRPLNEKEIAQNDVADWECINSTTILYRNSLQERSGLPTAYSFDRVFRGDCKTREVYDEEIKDIALSVVGGINSTIFAYGQTSSGKTYTMNGITEYTVADIYEYMKMHDERAFALKFSAMEIYNEVVRDLLSSDNNQLRLLDDPEKGMIIEKLTEETLRDWNHLKELLSICEAQRQIGETSLNEKSSRSHQILRLTIESSAREFIGKSNSTTLAASVNFVDLAGSERASQAQSVGQRLKEGCHINRSLLTLGTVIRKLSKGRHGHVNYRDSKLTRILQPALGGNARTAIICTLNPSRSHVEQSRNTLLFASCAKEVSTNAKVNVVMSDKALVKHLQKEVARLESELKAPGSTCDHGPLLRKKDMHIEKLEKEIRELKKQRDLAHSRIDDLLRAIESEKSSSKANSIQSVNGVVKRNGSLDILRSQSSQVSYSSDDASDPSQITEEPMLATAEDFDEVSTDIRCIEVDESAKDGTCTSSRHSTSESEESTPLSSEPQLSPVSSAPLSGTDNIYSHVALEQNIQGSLFNPHSDETSPSASTSTTASGGLLLTRSRSCRANMITAPLDMGSDEQNDSTPPTMLEKDFTGRPEGAFQRKQWKLPPVIYGTNSARLTGNVSQSTDYSSFIDDTKNGDGDEDIPTLGSFVAGLREMAKLQYENQTTDQVQLKDATDGNNTRDVALDPMNDWAIKFEMLQKSIIELWQACNVSLIHRTYFILLIKEDMTDSIYMEVEHRRLSFLKETFSRGNFAVQDGRTLTLASSKKALRREREILSRRMSKAFTEDERNRIYEEWGIDINSKRRRMRLVQLLWRDTEDMNHIRKSGEVVAKLIGFSVHGQGMKEMLGLSFMPPQRMMSRRSLRWINS
ncbi:kinesin-like protein KIN-7F [Salvia splendens]|uniref:kinesin-like protein KIN-7F n=1 Tax=Salvia splendens TaxID=180675 RepID=UPI001C251A5E|nr:kinesin-like protein KIN-7F [Salvia splendens]XP_041997804.1 kinesin-like protein KIN-7F [Salvia splendens]XP_041997805.1 kinesin-like protein KIN-7F [Salvia splendens]XP_041997806.1 kinesin-like protein KIN-7F [Salvia splendens]XP_041997807.1 kinesin-like protein KIN-7F [Salvia splendens]XP_041997809.1 kinesin-like protein KIN-7F [Salvia splendens]XP_041997810.1 kinesin-like protein KIN-7F [Salvia splendens]XP_041997811.1 kinesin-like protein KIN-7F [Salvia splendens]